MTSTTAVSLRRTDLPRLSVSVKAAATVLAIVAAVALPQLFHVIGAVSGRGTALGVAFLPMHLPIIFVGLIAGPAVWCDLQAQLLHWRASCFPACRCWLFCRS